MKAKAVERLKPGVFYHIYNRGTNASEIFSDDSNYHHFLKLFEKYISSIADCYAWALMNNHFHFLVKIKDKKEIIIFQKEQKLRKMKAEDRVFQQFSNFFNAYTKAYNKKISRTGSLFEHPFRRKKISEPEYFRQVILYIHTNPVKHKLCDHPIEYPWTSYLDFLSKKPKIIEKEIAVGWFDKIQDFKRMHDEMVDMIHFEEIQKISE